MTQASEAAISLESRLAVYVRLFRTPLRALTSMEPGEERRPGTEHLQEPGAAYWQQA